MRITSPRTLWIVAAAVLSFVAAWALAAAADDLEFHDVRSQTAEFMRYHETIRLDAAQQQIFEDALTALPAPCCSDNTALTCCCPCNAARTWWGLSKHLIAERGYSTDQVTAKVAEWFAFTNPGGSSGDACYTRGCGKAFKDDGCGGMSPDHVQF